MWRDVDRAALGFLWTKGTYQHAARSRAMALFITDDCIRCGACEPACPNEAVGFRGDIYVIHVERCTECVGFRDSPACQEACPVDCCVPDPDHPESEGDLVRKVLALHPDDESLRRRVEEADAPSRYRR